MLIQGNKVRNDDSTLLIQRSKGKTVRKYLKYLRGVLVVAGVGVGAMQWLPD